MQFMPFLVISIQVYTPRGIETMNIEKFTKNDTSTIDDDEKEFKSFFHNVEKAKMVN